MVTIIFAGFAFLRFHDPLGCLETFPTALPPFFLFFFLKYMTYVTAAELYLCVYVCVNMYQKDRGQLQTSSSIGLCLNFWDRVPQWVQRSLIGKPGWPVSSSICLLVWGSFMSTWHNPELSERMELQLIKYLHKIQL